jgi:hypothetical protein
MKYKLKSVFSPLLTTLFAILLLLNITVKAQSPQGEIIFDSLDFKILRVWGTHTERGYAYGYIAGYQINSVISNYIKPAFGANYSTARNYILAGTHFQIEENYFNEASAIIEGMNASGNNPAGLDAIDIMVGNCMLDIQGLMGKNSGLGCSSLMSWGDATSGTDLNGEAIVTRHLDWYSNSTLLNNHLLIVHQPSESNEQNWMMVGFAGMVGALSGVNNQMGIFQHVMSDYNGSGQPNKQYKPIWLAMRQAIEQTDYNNDGFNNVLDVKQSFNDSPNGFAGGYLISALAKVTSIDSLTALVSELTPSSPTHTYRTNSYPDSIPGDNLYSANYQIARNDLMHLCSRYNAIRNHIGNGTLLGLEESWNLMRDWSHQSNNIQVMQFAPAQHHFRIGVKKTQPAYLVDFIDLDLNELLNTTTSVSQINSNPAIIFYPNPVKDQINFNNLPPSSSPYQVRIVNGSGLVVEEIKISGRQSTYELPISHLKKGIYLIKIQSPDHVFQQKIVKH